MWTQAIFVFLIICLVASRLLLHFLEHHPPHSAPNQRRETTVSPRSCENNVLPSSLACTWPLSVSFRADNYTCQQLNYRVQPDSFWSKYFVLPAGLHPPSSKFPHISEGSSHAPVAPSSLKPHPWNAGAKLQATVMRDIVYLRTWESGRNTQHVAHLAIYC